VIFLPPSLLVFSLYLGSCLTEQIPRDRPFDCGTFFLLRPVRIDSVKPYSFSVYSQRYCNVLLLCVRLRLSFSAMVWGTPSSKYSAQGLQKLASPFSDPQLCSFLFLPRPPPPIPTNLFRGPRRFGRFLEIKQEDFSLFSPPDPLPPLTTPSVGSSSGGTSVSTDELVFRFFPPRLLLSISCYSMNPCRDWEISAKPSL